MRRTAHWPLAFLLWPFWPCAWDAAPAQARPEITAVSIDLANGHSKTVGADVDRMTTPGSTLKPLVLFTALRTGIIGAEDKLKCSGNLRIGKRNLSCTHPHTWQVLDAQQALAYSCNSYFAQLAAQMPSQVLVSMLRQNAFAVGHAPESPEEAALLALGLDGVHVSPRTLARAYARLAEELETASTSSVVVYEGMIDSVRFGMAHGAQVPGLLVGGKTGTAHDPAPVFQHGWFAGIVFSTAPPYKPQRVVVVYAPGGNGNDAALAARGVLQGLR